MVTAACWNVFTV